MLTVATPAYLEQHGIPSHPRDLKDHNYIVYSDNVNRSEGMFQEDGNPLHIKLEGNLQSNNSEILRSALLAGLGISRVPRWLVGDRLKDGSLQEVLRDFQAGPSDIHAVYSPGRHLPSKIRCFIDYFSEQFQDCSVING
jgi:DNA-binding transcriptional LysR family regulator